MSGIQGRRLVDPCALGPPGSLVSLSVTEFVQVERLSYLGVNVDDYIVATVRHACEMMGRVPNWCVKGSTSVGLKLSSNVLQFYKHVCLIARLSSKQKVMSDRIMWW